MDFLASSNYDEASKALTLVAVSPAATGWHNMTIMMLSTVQVRCTCKTTAPLGVRVSLLSQDSPSPLELTTNALAK